MTGNLYFEIGQLIAGGCIGWLIAVGFRNFEKPPISVSLLEDHLNTHSEFHKFLHLKVTNHRRSFLGRLLFGEKAALFCTALVKYKNDTQEYDLFNLPLKGRWSSTGEPVTQIGDTVNFEYNKVPALRFEHILPGEDVHLAVAIKWKGEEEFYAFDNESYAVLSSGFRDKEKIIKNKVCCVSVKIASADGQYGEYTFKIINTNTSISSFRLS